MKVVWCISLLLLLMSAVSLSWCDLPTVNERIYKTINVSSLCFRLTNATHQIGCSGSYGNTRGVVHYVAMNTSLSWVLESGPHPPYLVLLEPELFTKDIVLLLQSSSQVSGLLLRYENNITLNSRGPDGGFSPERACPNEGFGDDQNCETPWNRYANDLLFHDFGDFPIFALTSDQFQSMIDCFSEYNVNSTSGSYSDYPLCSAEVSADMAAAVDTTTCLRREYLPINYLSGVSLCQELGDYNVWGTLFELPQSIPNGVIMLSTKLDSVSFFPSGFSFGAKSEVAGIVVLLAVIEQLGRLQKSGNLTATEHPILYSFFHGESWDYIGSSRMVYDMENNMFPNSSDNNTLQLPLLHVSNISKYIELSQLGLPQPDAGLPNIFLHGTTNQATNLTDALRDHLSLSNFTLTNSSRADLPPASLHRFLRAGIRENTNFEGYILAAFDSQFNNKFFGSRYDDQTNLVSNSSLESVAEKLGGIATALTQTVLQASGPDCSDCVDTISADTLLIKELLNCFLVNSNCSLFRNVTNDPYRQTLFPRPLSRYISVSSVRNTETSVVFQLAAMFTAYNDTILPCADCLGQVNDTNQIVNITVTPYNNTLCHCLESYTYMHRAVSPAFENDGYNTGDYSTWAESDWKTVSIRMYLTNHYAEEVGVLFGGITMTVIFSLMAVQCRRRSNQIFQPPDIDSGTYHIS